MRWVELSKLFRMFGILKFYEVTVIGIFYRNGLLKFLVIGFWNMGY